MKRVRDTSVFVMAVVAIHLHLLPVNAAPAPLFRGLGFLPGGTKSYASGVASDGLTVVGYSSSAGGSEAFRWTAAGGMQGLGYLPGARSLNSTAYAVSADGSTVVGVGASDSPVGIRAFRWTSIDGMQSLGTLPLYAASQANDISAAGDVVVGTSNSGVLEGDDPGGGGTSDPFRWTAGASGMVSLGYINTKNYDGGGHASGGAFGVSGDGSTIVGQTDDRAFRWSSGSGMQLLEPLLTSGWSVARGANADGSVIVGVLQTSLGHEAFRWTESGGMHSLGTLPLSSASAVSADGSTIVGSAQGDAFLWDQTHGMRSLHDVLVNDCGLDLTGWSLQDNADISADGLTITGTGINPSGQTEAWIAVIPEPAALPLLTLFGAAVARRRLRRSP